MRLGMVWAERGGLRHNTP